MLYKIKDEKQTGKYRLLIVDNLFPKPKSDYIFIDGVKYKTAIVYDFPDTVAIECDKKLPSLIGSTISTT